MANSQPAVRITSPARRTASTTMIITTNAKATVDDDVTRVKLPRPTVSAR